MRVFSPLLALLALGCSHATDPVATGAASAAAAAADPMAALAALTKRAEADHLYDQRCVSFATEGPEQGKTLLTVREKHGDGCPGDPGTSPALDHYRVDAQGAIEWMDVGTGSYVPYAKRPRR